MADELAVLPHFHLILTIGIQTQYCYPHCEWWREVPSSVVIFYDVVEDVSLLRLNDVVNDVVQRLYPKSDQSTCLLSQVRLYSHSIDLLKT
jgi:hypothetical protein